MLYSQRARLVRSLQKCKSSAAISYALKHNKFEEIGLLVFEPNKLELILEKDNFPEPQTLEALTFTREQFQSPVFEYSPTKQFEVFLVKDQKDWMPALSDADKQLFTTEIEKLKPFLKDK